VSISLALLAYFIDRVFGEFPTKHPVVFMGEYIKWFERRFYKDRVLYGAILTTTLILITLFILHLITLFIESMPNRYINIVILAIIASTTISSKMLYESVKETIAHPQKIRYLVSRDTQNLTSSEIKRASIETYAENLSDGVIAPLLYLLLFGVEGAFLYKAINTLDSMVGYRNSRYEKFGKFSAILDDIANYIPSRITALLIAILFFNRDALLKFYSFGKKHDSPNAGHPISSMALSVGLKLGGDTPYFGKMKRKPYFGDGRVEITIDDIYKALSFQLRLDILLLIILGVTIWA